MHVSLKKQHQVLHVSMFFSAKCVTLEPGATRSFGTDIGLKFSKKYVPRLYPRSGLSLTPVILGGGVVNSDFRGIICVILANLLKEQLKLEQEIE